MNDLVVILLGLILATMLLGRDWTLLIIGILFFGAFVAVAGVVLMSLTDGAIIEWGKIAFALVFVAAYGFLFSYLIWSGLKWMRTRLIGGQDNG